MALTANLTYSPTGSSGENGPYGAGTSVTITATFNLNIDSGGGVDLPKLQLTDGSGNTLFGGTGASMTEVNNTKYTLIYTVGNAAAAQAGTFTVSLSNATSTGGAAIDNNNVSNRTFDVDNVIPTLDISSNIEALSNDNTPSFIISVSEAGTLSTNIVQADTVADTDNVLNSGGVSGATLSLAQGNHTVTFAALSDATYNNKTITFTDAAGNSVNASFTNPFTIDTVVPNLTIDTQVSVTASNKTNDNTPSFQITVNKSGTLSTSIDSNDTISGTATVFSTGATINLTAGTHTITFAQLKDATYSGKTITFTDSLGSSDQETLSNFIIDTVVPVLSQITAINTNTNDNTPTYTFRSTKAGTLTTSITQGFSAPNPNTVAANTNTDITFNTLPNALYDDETITITDDAGNQGAFTIPDFTVDATQPTITSISATSGIYVTGQTLDITVQFSENVNLTGTSPTLTLNTTPARTATLKTTNNDNLIFEYTILAGDEGDPLNVSSFNLNGGAIRDVALNALNTAIPTGGQALTASSIEIDGSALSFTIVEHVAVDELGLTNVLAPSFTISSNHQGTLSTNVAQGLSSGAYLIRNTNKVFQFSNLAQGDFNGKTITFTDNGGATAELTLSNFTIDSVQPQVTSIAANENNTFKKVGSGAITITVTFNDPVTVRGSPTLVLNNTAQATYAGANGDRSNTHDFTFNNFIGNVNPLNVDSIDLTSGFIEDDASNNVVTNVAVPAGNLPAVDNLANDSIKVDNTDPTISSVTATHGSNIISVGTKLTINVTFDENILVSSVSDTKITLNNGTILDLSSAAHNDNTIYNTLIFEKNLLAAEDVTQRNVKITALTLANGATILDQAGNSFDNSTIDFNVIRAGTAEVMNIVNKALFISSSLSADDNRRLPTTSTTNFFVTHSDIVDVSFEVWPSLNITGAAGNATIKLMNGNTQLDSVNLSSGALSAGDSVWTGLFTIPAAGVAEGENITLTIENLESSYNTETANFTNVSNFQKTIQIDTTFGTIIDVSSQEGAWEGTLVLRSDNALNHLSRAKEGETISTILPFTELVPEPEFNFKSGNTIIAQNRLTYSATGNTQTDIDFGFTYSDEWTISYVTAAGDEEGTISWYLVAQDVAGNTLRAPDAGYQDSLLKYDRTLPVITSIVANPVQVAVPFSRIKNGNRVDISLNISDTYNISQAAGSSPSMKWGLFADLATAQAAALGDWNDLQQGSGAGSAVSVIGLVGVDDTSWEANLARYWPGDGDLYFRTSITDLANNNLIDVRRASGANGDLVIDNTSPTLVVDSFTSNNAVNANRAKNGNTITLSFRTDNNEALALPTAEQPVVNRFPIVKFFLGNGGAFVQSSNDNTGAVTLSADENNINITATYQLDGNTGQNGQAADAISYQIQCDQGGNAARVKDTAMNNVTGVALTTSTILLDTTPATIPTPGAITIVSNNATNNLAKNGDEITLTFVTDDQLTAANVTIDGSAANVNLGASSPWTHTATHTIPVNRASTTGVLCDFVISGLIDTADNTQTTNYTRANTQAARTAAGNDNVTIDNTGQAITLNSFVKTDGDTFDNTEIRSGENARLTFSFASNVVTDGTDAEFLASNTVTFFDSGNNQLGTSTATLTPGTNTYVANFTIPAVGPNVVDGVMEFSITGADNAGNAISLAQTAFGSLTIDNTAPVIVSANVSILSLEDHPNAVDQPITDPSNSKAGDTVRLTFIANESLKNGTSAGNANDPANSITITSGGDAITNAHTISYLTTNNTDDTIRVEYTVHANDTDGEISFSLTYHDLAGNESTAVRGATFLMPTVVTDTTAPTLVSLDIFSNRTFKLDPARALATDHSEFEDVVTIEVQYSESVHSPTITMFPSTAGTNAINLTLTDVNGNGTLWRATNTMHHTQPTGDIPFSISKVYDLAGNTLAALDNNDITTGNSVKHYTGQVNIIVKGAVLSSDTKFLDIYTSSLSSSGARRVTNGESLLQFDKGIVSAFDPVLGDVTEQVTAHDITSSTGGSLTIEYRYTDSIGRLFRAQRQISVGDPYIIPAFGEMYKLPDLDKTYRLFQHNNIYVNASVKKATKEKESQILDYYENLGGNKNPNQEIITDGYYYDKFFIKSDNNYILIDILNQDISYSQNAKEYFNIKVCEGENNLNSFYAGEAMKLNILFNVDKEQLGFSILLFKNPQIDNGIEILNNISKDSIGLLVRNYKPELFEINNVENTENIILSDKEKNIIEKDTNVIHKNEIFENFKE